METHGDYGAHLASPNDMSFLLDAIFQLDMSTFNSAIFYKCHSIFIIGAIDVIDVRESSPSVQEVPISLFLSHVS